MLWLSVERPGGVIFSYKLLQSSYYIWVYFVAIKERDLEALFDIWKDVSGFSSTPNSLRVDLQSDKFG